MATPGRSPSSPRSSCAYVAGMSVLSLSSENRLFTRACSARTNIKLERFCLLCVGLVSPAG